jgi:hypothetical protein
MQYVAHEQHTAFYVGKSPCVIRLFSEYSILAFEELDEHGSEDFVSRTVILTCQDT